MRGLYIHIPFCENKCPYCSFYSETRMDYELKEKYIESLVTELGKYNGYDFDTIYIGGGTPSVMPAKLLERLVDGLLKIVNYKGREFTIEANPESVCDDFISFINDSLISRISLGVQSTDDEVLKLLGRIHNGEKALKSAEMLKKTGRDLNLDMIYDIPGVLEEKIFETMDKICGLEPSHISAYSYDSSDTGYLKGFDVDNTLYEAVEESLEKKGYQKYEVSNFAKEGKASIHNSLYWQGEEYAGAGSSSHSMFYIDGLRERSAHSSSIDDYIKSPFEKEFVEKLSSEESIMEDIITGLRMKKGANIELIEKRFGKISKNLLNNIDKNIEAGLLEWKDRYLRTTKRGMLGLEYLSCSLFL